MTRSIRLRRFALGAAALLIAAAPAAFAQPAGPPDDGQHRPAQYDEQRRAYDAQYGDGAYDRYYADQNARAREACHDQKKGNEVGGALVGGIAGAVLGSNIARGGGREGGAIIGGVGGAALGSDIAKNSTHCDNR